MKSRSPYALVPGSVSPGLFLLPVWSVAWCFSLAFTAVAFVAALLLLFDLYVNVRRNHRHFRDGL